MSNLEQFTGFSEEKLDEIFSDRELSQQFYLLFIFALATGKSFDEVISDIGRMIQGGEGDETQIIQEPNPAANI